MADIKKIFDDIISYLKNDIIKINKKSLVNILIVRDNDILNRAIKQLYEIINGEEDKKK